jgi:PAS domain S-box-containing protein
MTDESIDILHVGDNTKFTNPAVESAVGYAPDDLVGESLAMLMPDRLEKRHVEAIGSVLYSSVVSSQKCVPRCKTVLTRLPDTEACLRGRDW